KLTDRLQDILKLKTPTGGAPKDKRFGEITIDHLLAHMSGVAPDASTRSVAIRDAHRAAGVKPVPRLPVTEAMSESYVASLDLAANPGATRLYKNCGSFLLGRVVAALDPNRSLDDGLQPPLFEPLGIRRIRRARGRLSDALADEARYQHAPRDGVR